MYRFLIVLFLCSAAHSQEKWKPFCGKLVYTVQMADTSLRRFYPSTQMSVITNDTLIRIENQTSFIGKQVMIKHMQLNKSYLLLETPAGDFAVQTNHMRDPKDSLAQYTYTVKSKRKRIAGIRAKKLIVNHKKIDKPAVFWVDMTKRPAYINTYTDLPGLPIHYYLPSEDGLIEYTLIDIKEYIPHKDAFGIPSTFKKVSFDEFLKTILPEGGNAIIEDEQPEKH